MSGRISPTLDAIRHYRMTTAEEEQMAARIAELEGDMSVMRLQLATRLCSKCLAKDQVAKLREALFDLVHMERTVTPDMAAGRSGKRRKFAYMQNGTTLAVCLDRARALLDDGDQK